MRIAVCFSGQPRTWAKCIDTWEKLFKRIEIEHSAKIDTFLHAWDNNTHSHGTMVALNPENFLNDAGVKIQNTELDELVGRLKPKDVLIEDGELGLSKIGECVRLNLRHVPHYGTTVMAWAAPQFYSVMKAAHLKKKFEYKHKMRYDVCIKMRYDLYFDDAQIDYFSRCDLKMPEPDTAYPCHTSRDDSAFPFYRFGDILWFADSVSFDRISDFYRWFPIIGERSFSKKTVSTEHCLYFYTKMLRMNVSPICVDPKVFRPSDYLQKKIEGGLPGELGNHELI